MHKLKKIIHRTVLYFLVVVFAAGAPLSVFGAGDAPAQPAENYTYDPSSQHWGSGTWRWDPVAGKYVPGPSPSPSPTTSATTPEASASPSPSPSPESSPSAASQPAATTDGSAVAPAGGNATVNQNTNASGTTNVNNNSGITNNLNSKSNTGNADVRRNTTAGDAASGDANAVTTIVNTVHSTVG